MKMRSNHVTIFLLSLCIFLMAYSIKLQMAASQYYLPYMKVVGLENVARISVAKEFTGASLLFFAIVILVLMTERLIFQEFKAFLETKKGRNSK